MLAILGDTHIPGRASQIPPAFIREIQRVRPEKILFTGDAIKQEPIIELGKIAPVVHVRGNMDEVPAPDKEIITWQVKILLLHGQQVSPRGDHGQLQDLGRRNGCKVVVSGHTHKPEVIEGNIVLLNPGSATGVWGGLSDAPPPSMLFVESNQALLLVKLIQLIGMDLVKKEFKIPLV